MHTAIEIINLIGIPAWLALAAAAVKLADCAAALFNGDRGGPMSQHLARCPMRT